MHVVANPTSLIASKERLTDILMDLIYPIADNQSSTLLRPPPAPQQVRGEKAWDTWRRIMYPTMLKQGIWFHV